ncbi:site-specific integrase [Solibacillus daqui]|uniref:site-specific integrase n=1 Tax=Solibacillus daqui TaxID=2912187 RepID=UPI002366B13C|nr:site-specific integrase [Solibacillus daqui]
MEPSLIPQLLEYIYRRNYTYGLFFETLFESGMRKGECAGLRLDDINWRENKLIVDETLEFQPDNNAELLGSTKNYSSTREITMRESYMRKLKTYVKYRTEQKMLVGELYHHELNLMFARDDGTPLPKATLWNVFKSAMDHIGHEPLPIHSTRHTHVAMLIEANWDMKSIADRLGHSSPVTTLNTYAHISNKVAEKSMGSFEKYMEKLGQ